MIGKLTSGAIVLGLIASLLMVMISNDLDDLFDGLYE